jgi:hypothetical protein
MERYIMPDKDKRFEVSIPFKVEEVKDGKPTPFFECNLEYHDMTYDGVVAIQAAMVGLLEQLNSFGIEAAKEMGLGEKLEKLIGKKK